MTFQKSIAGLWLALLCLFIIHCSASNTADSTATASELSENASAAVSALFGYSDANTSESLTQSFIIGYTFQSALAQSGVAGSNCDEVESGDSNANITFANDGTVGTFGPEGDSVTIDGETENFCANDGDWSTYEFGEDQFVQFDCSDDSSFFMTGGSGVWRETADGTEVAGEFEISTDSSGTDGVSVNCHGTIGDGSNDSLTLNCTDSNGEALAETTGLSCQSTEDDSNGDDSDYTNITNPDGSCTSADECQQDELPNGIAFVECRDFGADGSFCMYSCTEDSQCQELSDTLSCNSGECTQ